MLIPVVGIRKETVELYLSRDNFVMIYLFQKVSKFLFKL